MWNAFNEDDIRRVMRLKANSALVAMVEEAKVRVETVEAEREAYRAARKADKRRER